MPACNFKGRLTFHVHVASKGGVTLDLMIGRIHGTRQNTRKTYNLKKLVRQVNINYTLCNNCTETGTSGGVSATREGRQMSE